MLRENLHIRASCTAPHGELARLPAWCRMVLLQVKVAEHVLTGHKVAIKILNRKKIQAMDMEEKGGNGD